MPDALSAISTRHTPQSQPADPRQVKNAAGGYTFQVDRDARIHRFLTIGTTGGTYYASEQELTAKAAGVVLDAARENATDLVAHIVAVSTAGRAPRQNPAIFALAAASALGDDAGREAAFAALPQVCRTGMHLFQWAGYREQFGGWGRATRRAVGRWYLDKTADDAAYQAVKYRQREGWTHRDLLRLAHPSPSRWVMEPSQRDLLQWITHGEIGANIPPVVAAFAEAQATTDMKTWIRLIGEHPLSWEMLPAEALTKPAVWEALIARGMPQTALVRQLPRLTRLGVLTQTSAATRTVAAQLADPGRLAKGRVHPINLLVALRTYAAGHGARSDAEWVPVRQVVDALDAAFYAAFGTIQPAGKRTLIALDVSGSMTSPAGGLPISCREVAAALALVIMATEPQSMVVGYTSSGGGYYGYGATRKQGLELIPGLSALSISPRQRMDDAIREVSNLPFGGTDAALPLIWAGKAGQAFDTVISVTDNETYAGNIHPHQALEQYRQKTGIPARLAVVACTPTEMSIADPSDPGSIDVSGMDSAVPNLLTDFSRGDI